MFGANFVILAQIYDELSREQGKLQTDRRTADGQTQATTIPLQPERTRGKKDISLAIL